jgi:Anticodon binding domain
LPSHRAVEQNDPPCDRIPPMAGEEIFPNSDVAIMNPFSAADVAALLRERGWISSSEISAEQSAWCERAAFLLGPQAADRDALSELLRLVFEYDAAGAMVSVEAHAVMTRYGARDVIRLLARLLLDNGPCTPERFKEIVTVLKEKLDLRGREVLHPLRLALVGRAGEGQLDRVILLVDAAASAGFANVKTVRERVIEFCSALD